MIQPATTKGFDETALNRINKRLKFTTQCFNERLRDPTFAVEVPTEIGLKLTNRCDLRCTHCFQWNEIGYHQGLNPIELTTKGDLDIQIVSKVLIDTAAAKSDLYLWGGEPLIYSSWDQLIDLLEADPRNVVLCTNGLALIRRLESLKKISNGLTVLVSLEGLEQQHNNLRGKNSFRRILENVSLLLKAQEEGTFNGKISIASVISDDLVPVLYECCLFYENMGIDTIYFNFPWYIPKEEADVMDLFFKERFSWMSTDKGKGNSWHSFDWHLNKNIFPVLQQQMTLIQNRKWNIRIRFQPNLDLSEILPYIQGSSIPAQRKKMCLGISNRIDILADGSVTPCKKFTEFNVGNLSNESLIDVWQGIKFQKFREVHNNTLMSICSKCEILYSNGL